MAFKRIAMAIKARVKSPYKEVVRRAIRNPLTKASAYLEGANAVKAALSINGSLTLKRVNNCKVASMTTYVVINSTERDGRTEIGICLIMDRWSGVMKIPSDASNTNYYRVAASLCLSSSTYKTLTVPYANAIFFHGDRVQDTGNHVIERLYDLQKVAEIIVSKFGNSVNAWVIEACVFNGPFAIYKDFVPSVNQWGEPNSYSPIGFPASSSIVSLLSTCLQEARNLILKEGQELCWIHQSASAHHCPRTIVLGFSKGGVVMNQLMSEISSLMDTNFAEASSAIQEPRSKHETSQIIPASSESFLDSISEVHYIDVGLNSSGAYITDHSVVQRISQRLARGANSVRIVIHGTPRQWCDEQRSWILKEKDELVRLLKSEAGFQVHERFYFSDRLPDLQMHFEIIDAMDVS